MMLILVVKSMAQYTSSIIKKAKLWEESYFRNIDQGQNIIPLSSASSTEVLSHFFWIPVTLAAQTTHFGV